MDNKGYIFTTDAVLALVIFFVIAGSLLTYYTLPSYMGADHQHLEGEADAALALLTSSDDLQLAILKIKSNDSQKQLEGKELLKGKLNLILPADVAYDLKIDDESQGVSNDRGILTSNDRVSRYSVISAPAEGWIGRAWYKLEDVQFVAKPINTTQTLWNFHNYLANFAGWSGGFTKSPYWGVNKAEIGFSIPDDAILRNASLIIGCQGYRNRWYHNITKFSGTKDVGPGWVRCNYPLDGDWDKLPNVWVDGYRYFPSKTTIRNVQTSESTTKLPDSYTPYGPSHIPYNGTGPDPNPSYSVNVTFRNAHNEVNSRFVNWSEPDDSPFKLILYRVITKSNANNKNFVPIFNAKADVPLNYLSPGKNSFYAEFLNLIKDNYNMPWFSLLGEYQTSILVPKGIENHRFPDESETKLYNCAGAAVPQIKNDNNYYDSDAYYITYDVDTGVSTKHMGRREVNFVDYRGKDSNLADGKPFVIKKDAKTCPFDGSAVAREYEIDLTPNNPSGKIKDSIRILDAYTVVNSYGATDKVLVEVHDGEKWNEAFYSYANSNMAHAGDRGYGNTPGTIYIGDYLKAGVVNKVRVTVWDDASSKDYDFVGLVDTYNVVTFTSLPIGWDTFHFDSVQSDVDINHQTQSLTQTKTFDISSDPVSEKVMFFFGVGLDTSHVKLEVSKDNLRWETLCDSDTIPYALDIGAIDAGTATADGSKGGKQFFAVPTDDGNYTTESGKYYVKLTVEVGPDWKSGDEKQSGVHGGSACCELFSGSRVAVLYPKFLENMWVNEYADTAKGAKEKAEASLRQQLKDVYQFGDERLDKVQSEALYTGDMPNTVPIRLDLWRS